MDIPMLPARRPGGERAVGGPPTVDGDLASPRPTEPRRRRARGGRGRRHEVAAAHAAASDQANAIIAIV